MRNSLTFGDKLHLRWAKRIILGNHNVYFEYSTSVGCVVGTFQSLKVEESNIAASAMTLWIQSKGKQWELTPVRCL
jgi:hypothetical protein